MPKLLVHRRAARYIERMDARIKAQLTAKLEELASNPVAMPGVKPMAGEWSGFFRLRHGDLRVIYFHDHAMTQSSSPTLALEGMFTSKPEKMFSLQGAAVFNRRCLDAPNGARPAN